MKALKDTSKVLPSMEEKKPSQVSWLTFLTLLKRELIQLTPMSLQLESDDPNSECYVLNKVDLLWCAKWDPKDQQEANMI